ncbi:MAG: NHL repeat-containing protein [Gemmatimonadota bacterium]|nr:NHL repeat-containing protein [Gemmatimonadota bacterium]
MGRLITVCAFLVANLLPKPAAAHPGAGIVVTPAGDIYFVVIGKSAIYRIDRSGRLTVFVEDARLGLPHHLVLDGTGNIYTISDEQRILWRVSPDGRLARVTQGPAGAWGDPFALDSAGNVYSVAPSERSRIIRVEPDGHVATLAGSAPGFRDGPAAVARFSDLHYSAMALHPDGRLFVTDRSNIRVVTREGFVQSVDTPGIEIGLGVGLALDGRDLLVADYGSRRVVRVAPSGAAVVPGTEQLWATGVAVGSDGATYVLDAAPLAACVWVVRHGNRDRAGCVRPRGAAIVLFLCGLTGLLAAALALRPPPRRTTWALAVVLNGLLTVASIGLATSARLEPLRPLMAGLLAAAVVLPLTDRLRRAAPHNATSSK